MGRARGGQCREAGAGPLFSWAAHPALAAIKRPGRSELGRALVDELMLEGEDSLFDLDLEVEISDHDPVTALTDAAARHHASLIVVGCEQHSPLHKAFGTVTSELMSRSTVPVTAVGPHAAPDDTAPSTPARCV